MTFIRLWSGQEYRVIGNLSNVISIIECLSVINSALGIFSER